MKERKKIEKEIENLTNAKEVNVPPKGFSESSQFWRIDQRIAKFDSKMFYFCEVSTQNTSLHFHKVILNSF